MGIKSTKNSISRLNSSLAESSSQLPGQLVWSEGQPGPCWPRGSGPTPWRGRAAASSRWSPRPQLSFVHLNIRTGAKRNWTTCKWPSIARDRKQLNAQSQSAGLCFLWESWATDALQAALSYLQTCRFYNDFNCTVTFLSYQERRSERKSW